MIERFKCNKEDFEEYLDEQNQDFDGTTLWKVLQGKSEYGLEKSEKGYQTIATLKASLMASRLGLNVERASFYTKCLGAAFPAYGKEGEKCLKEYAEAHNLTFDKKEIYASVIEESLDWSGGFVFEGLREILLELFDSSKDSNIHEVELAKLCHEQMEILKIYDRTSRELFSEKEKLLDEEIEKKCSEIGIIGCKKQLVEYKNSLKVELPKMSQIEKEAYFKCLDDYKDSSNDECLIKFIMHEGNI